MLVQVARTPACHAGGHGFESRTPRPLFFREKEVELWFALPEANPPTCLLQERDPPLLEVPCASECFWGRSCRDLPQRLPRTVRDSTRLLLTREPGACARTCKHHALRQRFLGRGAGVKITEIQGLLAGLLTVLQGFLVGFIGGGVLGAGVCIIGLLSRKIEAQVLSPWTETFRHFYRSRP